MSTYEPLNKPDFSIINKRNENEIKVKKIIFSILNESNQINN